MISGILKLDEKSYKEKCKNFLICGISYKTSNGEKTLCSRFDQIDTFIKVHDKIRYLVLFDYSRCNNIFDKIKYLISEKFGIRDSINHNFARIKIDSYYLFFMYWENIDLS